MRKSIYLFLLTCFISSHLFSQDYRQGIGLHFTGLDFYGPQAGNYFLQDKLDGQSNKLVKRLLWEPSIGLSYWHRLSSHFDLKTYLDLAVFQYPISDYDSNYIQMKEGKSITKSELPYAAAGLKLNYQILPKHAYLVSPYVSAGLQGSIRANTIGVNLPIGLGFHVAMSKDLLLNLESNYQLAIGDQTQNHLAHRVGLIYFIKKALPKQEAVAMPIILLQDKDNDGIADAEDECPTEPGKKDMKGCPDTDGDGIANTSDLCPELKGLKHFSGCPDTDGDGLSDNKDQCPSVKGSAKNKGCPDTDNDGFIDAEDKCPELASSTNNGCPEINEEVKKKVNMAAKGINFETGSADIRKESFDDLDKIVEILKSDMSLLVDIEGHTDNVGKSDDNLQLSQDRADACKNYLVKKGIEESRISSVGYGDMQPAFDNTTEEGKSKNRRTEFKIKNY
ncbi:MAG: OmpA family protein [Bacteroidetes bacterium]|nr:OmpA family protein [Bacteroidota bacterium]